MAPIERITLFKIPKEEDRLRVLEQYKVLAKTATKVSLHIQILHMPHSSIYIELNVLRTHTTKHDANYYVRHQDGKPYILSAAVGQSFDDPRNKGYNVSVKTTFGSMEDMKYYDTECEAHKALKAVAKPVVEDILTTYYENVL